MMKCWVFLLVLLGALLGANASEETQGDVDMARLRANVTNLCIRAVRTEDVWATGARMKSHYRFSNAEMTELLSGCLPLLEGRTDYKVSYYHLYGLMQRTCGTNAAPVLAGAVHQNRDEYDVRYAYMAYCEVLGMDALCFRLAEEILDSDLYGQVVRSGVYKRVAQWKKRARETNDESLIRRCNDFYQSRHLKDNDFGLFVRNRDWQSSDGGLE